MQAQSQYKHAPAKPGNDDDSSTARTAATESGFGFWLPGVPNTANVHQCGWNEPHEAVAAWGRGLARAHKRGRLLVSPSKAEESGFRQGFSLVGSEAKASFKNLQPIGPYGPMPYQVWRSERLRERRAGDLDSWPRMRPFLFAEQSEAISLIHEQGIRRIQIGKGYGVRNPGIGADFRRVGRNSLHAPPPVSRGAAGSAFRLRANFKSPITELHVPPPGF